MTEGLIGEDGGIRPRIEIVQTENAGTRLAKKILYRECNSQTVLFLSGGRTPRALYETLANERKLEVGAVAMVDERFGDYVFKNQSMIEKSGLIWDLQNREIPFYAILGLLKEGMTREGLAKEYDSNVRVLMSRFRKKVAVLGLGADGHIAGIAPNRRDFSNPLYLPERQELLVSDFDDSKTMSDGFGERITLTRSALCRMDLLLVLVFGPDKKSGLNLILEKGRIEEVPGRILTTSDMAQKTILITDQKV